jgi:hypothetical protein
MDLGLENRIIRSNRHVGAWMDDEIAIADIESEKYYAFNPVATKIWSDIEHETVVKDLCARLAAEYDISPEQCAADVLPFLRKLHAKGLIIVT